MEKEFMTTMRKVSYDYKLFSSIAYITRYWDEIGKKRYLSFMGEHLDDADFRHLTEKEEGFEVPITLHLETLDNENLRLTLEFLVQNESDLADRL